MKFKEKSFQKKIIKDSRITMDATHEITLDNIKKEQENINENFEDTRNKWENRIS